MCDVASKLYFKLFEQKILIEKENLWMENFSLFRRKTKKYI